MMIDQLQSHQPPRMYKDIERISLRALITHQVHQANKPSTRFPIKSTIKTQHGRLQHHQRQTIARHRPGNHLQRYNIARFLLARLTNDTSVPPKVQQKAPGAVEDALPNKVHDTGNPDKYSHDKGHTHVPQKIAEALPKKVEEKVPDAIHDTSGKKSNPEDIRAQANRTP